MIHIRIRTVQRFADVHSTLASACTYLLAAVGGQIEDQNGQETDAHARYDQVDGVEKCFPAHCDVECDVQVRFVAARVELFVAVSGDGL